MGLFDDPLRSNRRRKGWRRYYKSKKFMENAKRIFGSRKKYRAAKRALNTRYGF